MRTSDKTLVAALRILSRDIVSDDGVANACIAEAADRIEELAAERRCGEPVNLLLCQSPGDEE